MRIKGVRQHDIREQFLRKRWKWYILMLFPKQRNKLLQKRTGVKFIIPSLIGVSIFILVPYIDIYRRAFFHGTKGAFAGFHNFAAVLSNDAFRLAMKNTGAFIGVCIPLLIVLSLCIAILIYNSTGIGRWIKTAFLLPMAISISAIVLVWKLLFDNSGILNGFLDMIGLNTVNWMESAYAFWILVFSYIWKNLGYDIVLWIAGLSMIPNRLYEAARIDGANSWNCLLKITLPNLKSNLFIICVLAVLNSFKIFREAYLVAGEYPNEKIYMIQHLFNNWFRDLALDKIAAGAVINSIILIFLIICLYKYWDKE
jgi:multiple sugar transport system permease protein